MPMPTIPSAATIRARIISDIEGAIGQTTPFLPKAWNKAVAGALTGLIILLYNAILWVYSQIFPEKADYAALVLLGKLVGISPTTSNKSVITARVFGTNGESVINGTTYFKSATGIVYQVTTGGTIAGGYFDSTLTALTAGEAGNIANGETLSIITPDPVLTGSATVQATITEGDDSESEESFRARVIARYKKRLTGGSPADYELWGLEAPHFIWVSPVAGDEPGTVWVYGEVDNQTDGIPTSGQLTTMLSYITTDPETGIQSRRPIGDEVTCLPITRKVFDFEINIKDATTQTKEDIVTALSEYLLSLSPYNEGVSLERVDAVTDTGANGAANDVAREANATILQLVMIENDTSAQVNSYVLFGGEKAKIGTVTFTDVV
jgi:uncharacterized phage protein gp47/JayE